MKNYAVLFAGIALMCSAMGCCCGYGGCGTGGCSPTYGYGGGCPGGNCGVAPGVVPQGFAPQGMYQNYNTVQANYPGTVTSPIMTTAYPLPFAVPRTASAPLEPLPTY